MRLSLGKFLVTCAFVGAVALPVAWELWGPRSRTRKAQAELQQMLAELDAAIHELNVSRDNDDATRPPRRPVMRGVWFVQYSQRTLRLRKRVDRIRRELREMTGADDRRMTIFGGPEYFPSDPVYTLDDLIDETPGGEATGVR